MGPDLDALAVEIDVAERAGLDVTKLREDLAKGKALREGILREYSIEKGR